MHEDFQLLLGSFGSMGGGGSFGFFLPFVWTSLSVWLISLFTKGGGGGGRGPNHQRGYAKWNLSWNYRYTLHTCFCMFGTNLYAQSVLINKISASQLSQKFVKRVRCWLGRGRERHAITAVGATASPPSLPLPEIRDWKLPSDLWWAKHPPQLVLSSSEFFLPRCVRNLVSDVREKKDIKNCLKHVVTSSLFIKLWEN